MDLKAYSGNGFGGQADSNQEFKEFKSAVIVKSCVGEFDSEYYKEIVDVLVDYYFFKIAPEVSNMRVRNARKRHGKITDDSRYTVFRSQDGTRLSIVIERDL